MSFWNVVFVLLVIAAIIYIYVDQIRPKLHAIEKLDPYFDRADARWAALWAKINGWKIEFFSFVSIFLLELPDLIDVVTGANIVSFVPMEYQRSAQVLLLLLALIRAVMTRRKVERQLYDGDF